MMATVAFPSTRALVLGVVALLLGACDPGGSGSRADASQAGTPPSGPSSPASTARFAWYLEGHRPAGETVIDKRADGRITSRSFVHWNNREYRTDAEVHLDGDGIVREFRVTGTSPFGAPIDERFRQQGGMAFWSTPGEQASVETSPGAFYVPVETLTLETWAALVRAAARRPGQEIDLLPSGRARVEKLTEVTVGEGRLVSLWAVHGVKLAPTYFWLDADMNLAAFDDNFMLGMVAEELGTETLEKLRTIQSEQDLALNRRLADTLAHRLDRPLIFENVAIADVADGVLRESHHVLVEDGRIVEVSVRPIERAGALRVDGTGRTLIPGLWDMHGHFALADGILNIAGGVTSVRDMASDHDVIMATTKRFDRGAVIGPNTFRAGFIDGAGEYTAGWAAETLEQALERVDFYADQGYVQIKLYSSVDPEWVAPIAARAHERGLRVSGHVPAFMSAEQAVAAGYDEIQHINMVFLNFLAGDRDDTRKQLRFTLYGDSAGNLDLNGEPVRAFLDLLKAHDVVVDPTAAIFDTQLRHQPGEPDPTFAAVLDHLPPNTARRLLVPDFEIGERGEAWERSAVTQGAMLKALHDHGIQLVPGSDAMPAFTLHRELELYAEAGIPAAHVLRMATLDSARLTGVADRKGSIEAGKDADLVLIEGDPFENPSAVRHATLVMKGDTWYRPDELYRAVGVEPFVPSAEVQQPAG